MDQLRLNKNEQKGILERELDILGYFASKRSAEKRKPYKAYAV